MKFRDRLCQLLGLAPSATDSAVLDAAQAAATPAGAEGAAEGAAAAATQPAGGDPAEGTAGNGEPASGSAPAAPAGNGQGEGTAAAAAAPTGGTAAAAVLPEFVPAADYRAVLERLQRAESGAEAQAAASAETEIAQEVDAAITSGIIHPQSRGYHVAACRAEGGRERFRALVAAGTSIHAPTAVERDASARSTGSGAGYTPDQLRIIRDAGLEPADLTQQGRTA